MLAWGKKVSPEFRAKVKEIAERLETDPNWLMAAMAFETGETFSPLVRMKQEEQLYYVESYKGKLITIEDVYMAFLSCRLRYPESSLHLQRWCMYIQDLEQGSLRTISSYF